MDPSTPFNFKRKTSMNNQVHGLLGQSWETNAPALSSTQLLLAPRVDSTVASGTLSLEQLWQIPAPSLGLEQCFPQPAKKTRSSL